MRFMFVSVGLVACGGKVSDLKDAVGEAEESYCDALCDWAVSCNETDREIDSAALTDSCLAAVEAADPTCADYADLSVGDSTTLNLCTSGIDDNETAGECGFFVSSFEEVTNLSLDDLLPADCLIQDPTLDTFVEARQATLESNTELCNRFASGICEATLACAPTDQVDAVLADVGASSTQEYCLGLGPISGFVSSCESGGLFEPEESLAAVPNTQREAARMCVAAVEESTGCFVSEIADFAVCGGAFVDPSELESLVGGLVDTLQGAGLDVPGLD
ncbi:MAG: hypothetical protein ACON4U_21055 [Myxococcota bacterium]